MDKFQLALNHLCSSASFINECATKDELTDKEYIEIRAFRMTMRDLIERMVKFRNEKEGAKL